MELQSLANLLLLSVYAGIGAGLESMTANAMSLDGPVNPKVWFLIIIYTFFLIELFLFYLFLIHIVRVL